MKNNKLILKLQQRFWSKKDKLFTGENQKIGLGANYDKKITINRFNWTTCIYEKRFSTWKIRNQV